MGTKLEAIQVLLNTASQTIKDLQLQIEINLRAKDRANYDTEDMIRTIEKVKK